MCVFAAVFYLLCFSCSHIYISYWQRIRSLRFFARLSFLFWGRVKCLLVLVCCKSHRDSRWKACQFCTQNFRTCHCVTIVKKYLCNHFFLAQHWLLLILVALILPVDTLSPLFPLYSNVCQSIIIPFWNTKRYGSFMILYSCNENSVSHCFGSVSSFIKLLSYCNEAFSIERTFPFQSNSISL